MNPPERPSFLTELKRRRVFRVAAVYVVAAFAFIQAAELIFPRVAMPDWTVTAAVVVALLGFPVACALAWAFDIGPAGLVRAEGWSTSAGATPRRSAFAWAGAGAVAAIVLLGAYATLNGSGGRDADLERSIAVLPFTNMSDDSSNVYFSDGITEDILTNLASIADLRVISRTSVMGYKGTTKNLRQIAQELGVAYIVEGSVRRAGNRVRITAQLIEADRDGHLWAENFDRELTDIFAIQTEIARTIADRLEAELSAGESARLATVPTSSIEAYDLYLQARQRSTRMAASDTRAALGLLRQALALDPDFALAQAELAKSLAYIADADGAQWLDSARVAAQRALRLDPRLAETWIALGAVHAEGGHLDSADAAFRRAVDLQPNNADATLHLGGLAFQQGRYDEALRWARRAHHLEPTGAQYPLYVGISCFFLKQDSLALVWLEQSLQMDPSLDAARHVQGLLFTLMGDAAEGRRRLEALLPTTADSGSIHSSLVLATIVVGDFAAAQRHLDRALALQPGLADQNRLDQAIVARANHAEPATVDSILDAHERHLRGLIDGGAGFSPWAQLGQIALMRGDAGAAIEAFETAYARGMRRLDMHELYWAADEPMRRDPRYRALRARADADVERMWRNVVANGW